MLTVAKQLPRIKKFSAGFAQVCGGEGGLSKSRLQFLVSIPRSMLNGTIAEKNYKGTEHLNNILYQLG